MDVEVLWRDELVPTTRIAGTRSIYAELVPDSQGFALNIEKQSNHNALDADQHACRLEWEGVELASHKDKQHEMQAHHYFREILKTCSGPDEEETHEFRYQDRYEVEVNELMGVAFAQQEFHDYCLAEHVEDYVEEEEIG